MPTLRDLIVLVCPACGTVRPAVRGAVLSAPVACGRCHRPLTPQQGSGPAHVDETVTHLAPIERWSSDRG